MPAEREQIVAAIARRRENALSLLPWPVLLAAKYPPFNPDWTSDVMCSWFDGFLALWERLERHDVS